MARGHEGTRSVAADRLASHLYGRHRLSSDQSTRQCSRCTGMPCGGQMTSRAVRRPALVDLHLAFLSFSFHPRQAGHRARRAARHRPGARCCSCKPTATTSSASPGSAPVVKQLGDCATLHIVDHADHNFHVLVLSGRTRAEVLAELCDTAVR